MPRTTQTPGLRWRPRRNGAPAAYWVADKKYIELGYRPRSVRLHYEKDDPLLASRCHFLHADMLNWAANNGKRAADYDGTLASLVKLYETHPDSPYREVEQATQRVYSKTLALLMKLKGKVHVDSVTGSDVKRWYKELTEAKSRSWAYYTVNVLKVVVSFGATLRLRECQMLREELSAAKFRGGAPRKERMTFAQVEQFCAAAHDTGMGWMALLLRMQFNFGLRRRDIIGVWIDDEAGTDGIRRRRKVWRDGLTWQDIDARGILVRVVSKTRETSGAVAAHSIHDYPDLLHELALNGYPAERRLGPIIINPANGLPPGEAQCRRYFRRIARKAGIPDNVWNMDARAGANTEAYEAGATEEEAMALLSHSERDTNRGYLREVIEQSRRAAQKRVASRGKNSEQT